MRFPEKLKIGAHVYRVVFADSWPGCEDNLGETFYEDEIIYIKKELSDTNTFQTLFHEIFHVLNAQLDHVLLESLSEQWTQVLLDNGLVKEK